MLGRCGLAWILLCLISVDVAIGDEKLPVTRGEASTESPADMSQSSALNWTLFLALAIAITHITSPATRRLVQSREASFGSFGGGMASGYVFIHLFGELSEGEQVFGDRLHLFILIGFLAYYGAEFYLSRRAKYDQPGTFDNFHIELVLYWVYSWLMVYSLPDELSANGLGILPIVAALTLHICFADADLGTLAPRRFDRIGRWVLATAPLAGWVTDLYFFADNPMVSDGLTALMAGFVMGKLFRHELPQDQSSSFLWYLAGSATFVTIDFFTRGA